MLFTHTEPKAQNWRALAVFADGSTRLLYVGRSAPHVQAGYAGAFAEVLDADERAAVVRISLQRWDGAADQGRWIAQASLAKPPEGRAVKRKAASPFSGKRAFASPPGSPAVRTCRVVPPDCSTN